MAQPDFGTNFRFQKVSHSGLIDFWKDEEENKRAVEKHEALL